MSSLGSWAVRLLALLAASARRGLAAAAGVPLHGVRSAYHPTGPELLRTMDDLEMMPAQPPATGALVVDSSVEYQEIMGFGGAFTEATVVNWMAMTPEDKEKVMHLYFADPSEGGMGYTIGRVPMGSCDFSPASYNFDNVTGDKSLAHFDHGVTHDEVSGMLPMIREAQKVVSQRGQELKMFASPWSPPAWMKVPVNGKQSMLGSAKPHGLLPEYRGAWAKYFSYFIEAYRNRGVNLWGVTVQNEPENAGAWECCAYTPEYMASFVRDFLGPVLKKEQPGVKIMGFDHNKDHVAEWAKVLYADPVARDYLAGIAVHWYGGLNTDNLEKTHEYAPEKFIMATEACNCGGVVYRTTNSMSWWQRAEALAIDMLEDLRFWSVGWVDWNLVVSTAGGPNHLGNLCDANIIADPRNITGLGTLIMQASFYYIGHFSRFIPPGSKQIRISNTVHVPAPKILPSDVQGKRLYLQPCGGSTTQNWHYDDGSETLAALGMCAQVVSDGFGIMMATCNSSNPAQQWARESVPSSGFRLVNAATGKCFSAATLSGAVVGLDPGVDATAGVAMPCGNPGDAAQTFELPASHSGGVHLVWKVKGNRCVEPVGLDKMYFDAVAFKTPSGSITLVAMNIADFPISFGLHDAGSNLGVNQVELPPHSIVTFTWEGSAKAAEVEGAASPATTQMQAIDAKRSQFRGVVVMAAVGCGVGLLLITFGRPLLLSWRRRRDEVYVRFA